MPPKKLKKKKQECEHGALIISLYGKLIRATGEIDILQKELKIARRNLQKASKYLKGLTTNK